MALVSGYESADASLEAFEPTPGELREEIVTYSCGILFVEDLFVPLCYLLGMGEKYILARIIQVMFLGGSARRQWLLYKKLEQCWQDEERCAKSRSAFEKLASPLKTFLGLPVGRLNVFGVSVAQYYLFSLAPNTIDALASAFFVGSCSTEWSRTAHAENHFSKMWATVPYVGPTVGDVPLPQLLTYFLAWLCLVHVGATCYYVYWPIQVCTPEQRLINTCDAANMSFIGKVLSRREQVALDQTAEYHACRFFATFTTKTLLLWGKISLLSVIVDGLGLRAKAAAWQAIILAWYTVAPLALDYLRMVYRFFREFTKTPTCSNFFQFARNLGCFPFVVIVVVVLPPHIMGVALCPKHNFSLVLLQCT